MSFKSYYTIFFIAITSILSGFTHIAAAFKPCLMACDTAHHKSALARFGFEGANGIEYTELTPFALTGFGYGLANDNIVLPPGSPNPQLQSSIANWIDFRFYASFPGIGLVKGSLNEDYTSYVLLNALTEGGLFPAEFTNNMFIKLEPLAYPGLIYENTEALQLHAPSINSAPPDSSITTTQIGTDVFHIVDTPPPGIPVEIIFENGVQNFLEPNTGLNLEPLPSSNETLMKFHIENQLDITITVAYFLYFKGDSELAKKVQNYDGTIELGPQSHSELSFDISNIPGVTPDNAVVQAMILEPIGLKGADSWIGSTPCYIKLSSFNVIPENNSVHLEWITASELNNAGFRIWRTVKDQHSNYKSTLLKEFKNSEPTKLESNEDCSIKIQGQLKETNLNQNQKLIFAVGNSTESTCYSFTDTSNLDGTYYYLLEDISDNGKSTFYCDHIDVVTIGQGPNINLGLAKKYCKEVTKSNN